MMPVGLAAARTQRSCKICKNVDKITLEGADTGLTEVLYTPDYKDTTGLKKTGGTGISCDIRMVGEPLPDFEVRCSDGYETVFSHHPNPSLMHHSSIEFREWTE